VDVPSNGEPTPGTIACAAAACTIAGFPTNLCCFEGITTQCLPSFPGCVTIGRPLRCDDAADCDSGDVCCGTFTLGTTCASSCGDAQLQLCRTDRECRRGSGSGTCSPHAMHTLYSTCQ
jgi:hypothetical protein